MNDPRSRIRLPMSRRLCGALSALLLLPAAARAELTTVPYGAAQYEYDSNVFALSSRADARALDGSGRRADEVLRAIAGLETSYQWDRQKLRAQAEGRRLIYQHFDQLDHNEYLLGAGLDLKLFTSAEGTLDFRQERRQVAYADRQTTQRELERERDASGDFKVLVAPEWRVDAGARTRKLDSPLPLFPGFGLTETYGSLGLDYLGVSKVTAGVLVEYGEGSFRGVPDAASYRQETAEATATYAASGLSAFNAKLGYTRFENIGGNGGAGGGGAGQSSGFAGSLGYTRTVSAKTDLNLQAFRRTESYSAGANAVTDTGFSVGGNWRPTDKLAAAVNYEYVRSSYQILGSTTGATASGRRDHGQATSLSLSYQMLRWLALRTFGEYRARTSNTAFESYNEAIAGAELRLRFQ